MLRQPFPGREAREEPGPCSVLASAPLGEVMDVPSPRHRWGLSAGRLSRAPARLQLYFLSHQQDLSAAVSGPVMDVDSSPNSLCET